MYETIHTGMPTSEHGIVANTVVRRSTVPNIFQSVVEAGKVTAAVAYYWVSELYNHAPFDWINDKEVTPVTKDLQLQPIEVGVTVRLKNIYFDFDKTTLKNESFTELNKVVDFLKSNPSVEIEISGHTDSKGSDDYNASLSQGRSEEVVNYIISQGIDSYRLTAHGYGEAKPIDTNDSEEGRANNRRVEFTVMKK